VPSTSNSMLGLGLALAGLTALVAPAFSGDEGEYLSRRDTARLSAGNAPASNIAIQHPTPWPWYVNGTTIPGNGYRGVNAVEQYYAGPGDKGPQSTTINPRFNITVPAQ